MTTHLTGNNTVAPGNVVNVKCECKTEKSS